jgi:hypothetical protein
MVKLLKIVAFVFLLLLIWTFSGTGAKPVTAELVAAEAARRVSFPVDLGEGFRLDSISASGNTVISTVTLLNQPDGATDPALRQVLDGASRSDICRELAGSRDVYVKANLRLAKRYLNSAGGEIVTVTVDPASCP